jgi:HK97 gp10 family phage protein
VNEFDRYAADLVSASEGIDEDAERAMGRVGRGVLLSAEQNAPVLTGFLRQSLYLIQRGTTAIVATDDPKAVFVEYGTSDTRPQPFIGPAADEWEPELVREVEKIRDDVVEGL